MALLQSKISMIERLEFLSQSQMSMLAGNLIYPEIPVKLRTLSPRGASSQLTQCLIRAMVILVLILDKCFLLIPATGVSNVVLNQWLGTQSKDNPGLAVKLPPADQGT